MTDREKLIALTSDVQYLGGLEGGADMTGGERNV